MSNADTPNVQVAKAQVGRPPNKVLPTGTVATLKPKLSLGTPLSRLLMASSGPQRYSIVELRAAATLPFVQAVIQTVIRDILSSSFEIVAKTDVSSDKAEALYRMLKRPVPGDDWRGFLGKHLTNLLTIGRADCELLRSSYQSGIAKAYLEHKIGGSQFVDLMQKARKTRGPVVGFAYYDPATITANRLSNGTYGTPAFINSVGSIDESSVTTWDEYDFYEQFWLPAVEADRYGQGVGPVELAYPLIDLLYYYLYYSKDRLENPTIENLISLYSDDTNMSIDDDKLRAIVDQLHEDVVYGRTPVVRGIKAEVSNISNRLKESEYIELIRQFQLVMWQIVGAGFLEMGREAESGQTAEEYAAIARRQATGVIRQYISDFVNDVIIADPWSDWEGLIFAWKISEERWTKKELWRIAYPVALNTGVLTPEQVKMKEFPEFAGTPAPEEATGTTVQPAETTYEQETPVKAPLPTGRKSILKSAEPPDWAMAVIKSIEADVDAWILEIGNAEG